ncbi:MAG: DUF354 domain-containing protein [Flavobacteriales bacterium]
MKFLIDIGHPAHVHLFKNFARVMTQRGHEFLFTCRQKEFEIELLDSNGLQHISFGPKYKGLLGKLWGMLKFGWMEYRVARRFKPNFFLSHGSIYAAHASFLYGKPHISLEDTYNFEQVRLYLPFTKYVLTADYAHPLSNHPKNRSYAGYHELAYLHPNHYQPNKEVLKQLGLQPGDAFVILRFVSWSATHDIGHKGISMEMKRKAIEEFSKYARVFISSESELPEEFRSYQLKINPQDLHDALYFASLVWAESFTIPAECSVLGTPSIIMHNTSSLYLKEQEEKYQLCFNFSESLEDQERAIAKGIEVLSAEGNRGIWEERRNRLLKDKIDLTDYLVWFFENYPKSAAKEIEYQA